MDTWDLMRDWHLVLPPSRPSAIQLSLTRRLIANVNRDAPVAILGSTPEFRDFLFEEGFRNVFIFDKNLHFFKEMTAECIYNNDEHFVHGNWLDVLADYQGIYALILSDLTMGNIAYSDREQFYELISMALCEGGLFIDKVLTHPCAHISLDDIFAKYSQLPLNLLHINHFSCEALFCSELLGLADVVDTTKFYDILLEKAYNDRLRAFVLKAQSITPTGCIWYYGRSWEQISDTYCPKLLILADYPDEPDSPYYGRLHLFALQNELRDNVIEERSNNEN